MKLKDYLKLQGLTYLEFAIQIKVDPSTVHSWVSGKKKPRLKKALKIFEKTLGKVTLEDLGLVAKK